MPTADEDIGQHPQGPGRHRRSPQTIAYMLEQMEARGAQAGDETLISAVTTGRRALAQWQELSDRLQALEKEYERLAIAESRALARLQDVLDLLDRFVGQPQPSAMLAPSGGLIPGALILSARPRPGGEAAGVLAIRMLGTFELMIGGHRVVHWHGQRTQALMQFLTVHRHRSVPRCELIAAVWPDADENSGRHRLHQGVYELRSTLRAIAPDWSPIVCADGVYGVDHRVPVWVDVEEFDRLSSAAVRHPPTERADEVIKLCQEALELYRGDFLCQATEADWTTAERNRLGARFVLVSVHLGGLLARRGDYGRALAVIDPLLNMEPWNEDATMIKMRCHAQSGARSMAVAAYRSCAEALTREFGITPTAETIRVYDQIRSATPAGHRGAHRG